MTDSPIKTDTVLVRLANGRDEVEAAQRLRYKVFYEEMGATPTEEMKRLGRDINVFDDVADILVVLDTSIPEGQDQIVGTYRLLRQEIAEHYGHFYTSDEFNIQPLIDSADRCLELGRSCVLAPYRTRPVIQKLWEGIAAYVAQYNIGMMFGCASIPGTDVDAVSEQLAYLYHYHLAPASMCPRALDGVYVDMNLHAKEDLDAKRVFASLPPLIKGYLRLGACIGDGAYVDTQWNSIDVCIVMPTHQVTDKYAKHYERVMQKPLNDKTDATDQLEVVLRGTA